MTIFSKIIAKEIPATIIYEDDDVLAFLDLAQTTKGHTLVIPKKVSVNFLDVSEQDLQKVMRVAQSLAKQIKENLGAQGINILSNAGEIAGQTVMYFHVHIIPRYSKDDTINISFTDNQGQDLEAIAQEIKGS